MTWSDLKLFVTTILLSFSLPGCSAEPDVLAGTASDAPRVIAPVRVLPAAPYRLLAEDVGRMIVEEITDKDIPALSIALVADGEVIWADGFGQEDPVSGQRADVNTIYRVGSVSKLFTDLAVMHLKELGEVDLDAPASKYVQGFAPRNAFGRPITLRQLMCHRAGLVREPPTGHYFDPDEPSITATVASLNTTDLVCEPETRTKYSNAGVTVVGQALAEVTAKSFENAVTDIVLGPLAMNNTSFELTPEVQARLADARMWSQHGHEFDAPTFALGMAPAGNLYSSVMDLSRFLIAFTASENPVVTQETLAEMWTPQLGGDRFGLGFAVGEFEGRRKVGHGGAIYGFSTDLVLLPDDGIGVVSACSRDVCNTVVRRVNERALRLLLASREAQASPMAERSEPLPLAVIRDLAGKYTGALEAIRLVEHQGEAYLAQGPSLIRVRGQPGWEAGEVEVPLILITDDRTGHGLKLLAFYAKEGDNQPHVAEIRIGDDAYVRDPDYPPPPVADELAGLIGEYGWDHNILYIFEADGQLHALIEWFFDYQLTQVESDVFAFPDSGLYPLEELVFERDAAGSAIAVVAASVRFERRNVGTADGETFRIDPVRPVEELRGEALAATPPAERGNFRQPDLVDLIELDPTIRYDIRYASTNNFMNAEFYRQARALMQRPAAEAVVRVHQSLARHGYGLLIHDAYRPWFVTKMFFDATPESMKDFVADPAQGSRHNRGCAVDLTLYDLRTGEAVQMVGGYDEFSDRSFPYYPGGTARQRWLRDLLRRSMQAEGFDVYEYEWWHFDYADWRKYPILNLTFEEL